jgi:hypothetical protein
MERMPESRALVGIDVIGSANTPGYHRKPLWDGLTGMLDTGLEQAGITPDDVLWQEPTGDGALYTLTGDRLGAAFDLAAHLDRLARQHNRRYKPDIRLRIAVDRGPVGVEPGYYSPKIQLSRLINAPAFSALLDCCLRERPADAVHTGLITSAEAFLDVFGGDYTTEVHQSEFAEISVSLKEFADRVWVRVPGLDPRSLTEFARSIVPAATEEPRVYHVQNVNNGTMTSSVQAGIVHGGIHLGGKRQ